VEEEEKGVIQKRIDYRGGHTNSVDLRPVLNKKK